MMLKKVFGLDKFYLDAFKKGMKTLGVEKKK